MEFIFYSCSLIAILSTLRVITHINPMYSLIYLIISLIAISGVLFSIGAHFIGALEIIIYTGAIVVLFVFVVMMTDLSDLKNQEHQILRIKAWTGSAILSFIILCIIIFTIFLETNDQNINIKILMDNAKEIGILLFKKYMIAVELASMLLLSGLVVSFHIGHEKHSNKISKNENMHIKNNEIKEKEMEKCP